MSTKPTKTNVKSTIGDAVNAASVAATTEQPIATTKPALDVQVPQPIVAMDTLYTTEQQIEAACTAAQDDTKANMLAWQRIILSGIAHYVQHRNVNVLVNIVLRFPRVYGLNGLLNYLETYAPVYIDTEAKLQKRDEHGNLRVDMKGNPVMGTFSIPAASKEKLRLMTETPEAQQATIDKASRTPWWGKQVKNLPPYRPTNLYEQLSNILKADKARLAKAAEGKEPLKPEDYIPADALLQLEAFIGRIKPKSANETMKVPVKEEPAQESAAA